MKLLEIYPDLAYDERTPAGIDMEDYFLSTPLLEASREYAVHGDYRHFVIVKILLDNHANVSATNEQGLNPLGWAVIANNSEFVRFLVEEGGADVDQWILVDWTPLQWAGQYGHIEILEYLIEKGGRLDAQDKDGNTALHHAAAWGKTEAVKVLKEAGADTSVRNWEGKTALDTPFDLWKGDGGYVEKIDDPVWGVNLIGM